MLFNDQYIVKPSHGGEAASFKWHRDSDWCREGSLPQPYLSIWIALDDCDINNGCLHIRPRSHAASPQYVHIPGLEPKLDVEKNTSDSSLLLNVVDSTTAVPLLLSAGSAVIMTDVVEHASGPNKTQYARRGWMPQFSCQPILWKGSKTPVSLAIPLSSNGNAL